MSDELTPQVDAQVDAVLEDTALPDILQSPTSEQKAGTQDNLTFEQSKDENLCCIYQRTETKDFLMILFILKVGQAEYGRSLSFKLGTSDDEIAKSIAKDKQGVQERAGVK